VIPGPTGIPHVVIVDGKRRSVTAIREDWLVQDSLAACPDPDERLVMRIERIGERALVTEELT